LATILQGVREGYLPTTVSIYIDICEWPNHPTDFSQRWPTQDRHAGVPLRLCPCVRLRTTGPEGRSYQPP
jgi:hypothetical protein